jgi:hypothetical protein
VLFVSFAYFYEGGGWNQNTRFDLVRAILETRTVCIDLYHENTDDKAHAGAHFYTDKAPGASLIAVPAVGAVRAVMHLAHAKLYSREAMVVYSYVATLVAAALPAAIAGWCVFWVARRFGADDGGATLAAIVCGLGTPLWAYATIFYGHALAAGCLAVAYVGSLRIGDALTRPHTTRIALIVGLAAGWAVVTEYPASIPAGVLVLYAVWLRWKREPSSFARACVTMGVGLAFGAVVLLGYNWLAFGKPLYIGYTSEEGYAAMRTGIFGVNFPTIEGTYGILFGQYRGLLPLAPVLAITPVGFWFLLRHARTRGAAAVAAFVALYYFLLTAGYAYWSGGWSYGSRHLGPALPFLCVGLAPIWMRTGRVLRVAILVLALVGVGESLVAVATTPQPPNGVERPMAELLWPAFRSGDFPIGWQGYLDFRPPAAPMSELEATGVPRAAWNLGQLAGLGAFASLIPLLALWLAGAIAWVRAG